MQVEDDRYDDSNSDKGDDNDDDKDDDTDGDGNDNTDDDEPEYLPAGNRATVGLSHRDQAQQPGPH